MEMEQNQAEIEQTLTKHCWDTTGLQHLVAKKWLVKLHEFMRIDMEPLPL